MELHIHGEHCLWIAFPIPPPSLLCMMPPIKPPSQLSFAEEPSSNLFFPEFCELSSSVTSLDMRVIGTQRLTVFGCQNGYLQCSLVDITAGSKFAPCGYQCTYPQHILCIPFHSEVLRCWTSEIMDGPVTSVSLFTLFSRGAGESRWIILVLEYCLASEQMERMWSYWRATMLWSAQPWSLAWFSCEEARI